MSDVQTRVEASIALAREVSVIVDQTHLLALTAAIEACDSEAALRELVGALGV